MHVVCRRLSGIGVFLALTGCAGFEATAQTLSTRPPVSESFGRAGLPDEAYWGFSTNGQGRMVVAPGSLDLVPDAGRNAVTTSSVGRLRGNIYQVTNDTYLLAQDMWLDHADNLNLAFLVYEGADSNGVFSLISTQGTVAVAGEGYRGSGDLLVPLVRGSYYMLGAVWDGGANYGWRGSHLPQAVGFGSALAGFSLNQATTPSAVTNAGALLTAYDQRVRSLSASALISGSGVTNSNGNRFRGAQFACTNSTTLLGHSVYLARTSITEVLFLVYEATATNGTFSLISSNRVTAGVGSGYVTTPALSVPLVAGRFYVIGAGWTNRVDYFSGSMAGASRDFGSFLNSYAVSAAYPGATFLGGTNGTGAAYRQMIATGDRSSLRMDDGVADATYSTNFAQLRMNLAGYTNAFLTFRHRSQYDDAGAYDGLFISTNGTNYVRLLDLNEADNAWHSYTVDLVSTAATLGITLNAQTRLKFQQMDNYPWGTSASDSDGRAFDDIRVFTALPDFEHSAFSIPSALLRGTNVAHALTFNSTVAIRGGTADVPARAYAMRYQLQNVGLGLEFSKYVSWTTAVPALVNTSSSLVYQLNLAVGEKLTNVLYLASGVVDASNQLAEVSEDNTNTAGFVVNQYSGSLYFSNVLSSITVTDWATRTFASPTSHIISGTGTVAGFSFAFTNLYVEKNLSSLHYTVATDETQVIHIAGVTTGAVSGVDYLISGGAYLTRSGAHAKVYAKLPTGAGYATDVDSYTLENVVLFEGATLGSTLAPAGTLLLTNNYWYCEESKPFMIRSTDVQWYPTQGLFLINALAMHYVRGDELDELEAAELAGTIMPGQGLKRSNEQYHRYALVPGTKPQIRSTAQGVAKLDLSATMAPGRFCTHFPYDVRLGWSNSLGKLVVTGDVLNVTLSALGGASNIVVRYKQGCGGDCPGSNPTGTFTLVTRGSNLNLTLDGGVQFRGAVSATPLSWGYLLSAGAYAQQTDPFTNGTFFAPGCFLDIAQDTSGLGSDQGPGILLLSGASTSSLALAERPYAAGYANGYADYAGLNLRRPPTNQTFNATSLLGGEATPAYPLGGRAKYYARVSGVSGIHEARSGTTFDKFTIYGYSFNFSNYGLNYLSSSNRDSRTEGDVTLPYPSDITQDFEELKFGCLGDLMSATVPAGGGKHTLSYWAAPIEVSSINFVRNEIACSAGDGFLTLGVKTFADHVPEPLYGTLGFFSNGNLIAEADGLDGVDSTLDVMDEFAVAGPAGEDYTFYPANKLCLNDYAVAGTQTNVSGGFVSLGGTLDVPFFENMMVHLHTGAGTNNDSQLYLMGGWPDDGWNDGGGANYFNSTGFDTNNWGYPAGTVSLAVYRSQTNANYQARALKEWLGVVDFNYPLAWSTSTRSFRSPSAQENNFFVASIEHQVDYMSADELEVSFGAQYGDLPSINVANMMINAVNEATGVFSAFTDAATSEVVDTLNNGLDDMAAVLEDRVEELFDAAFDQALDPAVDALYDRLESVYVPGGADYYTTEIEKYIRGLAGAPATNVQTVLLNIAEGIGQTTGVIGRLDQALAKAEYAIDSVIGQVTVDPDTGAVLVDAVDGLLTFDGGKYPILESLGGELLQAIAGSIASALGAELDGKIEEQMAELQPTIEAAREALQQTRDRISDLRAQLATGQQFASELQSVVDPSLIAEVTSNAAADVAAIFADFEPSRSPFDDYTPAEIKAMIRKAVEDRFFASRVVGDIQTVVRAKLYDAESALREGVDTVFQQVNNALRSLASSYLSGIDDTINGFLDDLKEIVGAGQMDGHASIRGDALTELRIDAKIQFKVPDEVEYKGFLLIEQLDAGADGSCSVNGEPANKVTVGATEVGCSWLGSDIKINVSGNFTFYSGGLIGLGGSLDMVEGTINFEQFEITQFGAAIAFGLLENYVGANCGMRLDKYEVSGGLFFGKTCTMAPLELVDPDVANVLGAPPFTGGYVYGEGWMPIVNYGCVFNVSAGVGAGMFYFVEGPTFGAKMLLGASGEALCVVSIKGDITLVGVKSGDSLSASGKGKLSGKAGACPFCVKFKKTVTATYKDGEWDVDY